MGYTDEQIKEAKQMVLDLQSFSNRDIGHIANIKRVTDNTRSQVITALLIEEFGQDILNYRVYKPFGEDTVTNTVRYKN